MSGTLLIAAIVGTAALCIIPLVEASNRKLRAEDKINKVHEFDVAKIDADKWEVCGNGLQFTVHGSEEHIRSKVRNRLTDLGYHGFELRWYY